MHCIVNRTDFTLYLTKELWKRSSGLLVSGEYNDPSGQSSSINISNSLFYLIYLLAIFIFKLQ